MGKIDLYKKVVEEYLQQLRRESAPYDEAEDDLGKSRFAMYLQNINTLEDLQTYLGEQQEYDNIMMSDDIGKRFRDLDALPAELKSQLKRANTDELEDKVLEVIKSLNGSASIDEVMVEYYHHFKKILDRKQLAGKMFRMATKKLIFSIPKKKGIYSIKRPVSIKQRQANNEEGIN